MDVVLALRLEWYDSRLKWDPFNKLMPIREIRVTNDYIWTPNIDLANRLHEYDSEMDLKASVRFNGKIAILIRNLI